MSIQGALFVTALIGGALIAVVARLLQEADRWSVRKWGDPLYGVAVIVCAGLLLTATWWEVSP